MSQGKGVYNPFYGHFRACRDYTPILFSRSFFQTKWENEIEVLDTVEESERIRNKKLQNKSIADGDILIKKEKIKVKKKKRFLFF